MPEETNNKTIAQNTIFLYFRMMFTMIVSLYTSRVILQTLGVDDFGIYQAVGGIVGFMGFLNSALATGSSRYLTYAMGEGDEEKLRKTFSTNVLIHLGLAILIVIIAETIGLWFLNNKMVIPSSRMTAALWVYHLSIITMFLNITQVPYNAAIMSHERMSIYAYISIIEVSLKLLIVYLLCIGDYDKLILYAFFQVIISAGLIIYYRWYCINNFEEAKIDFSFDKKLFKDVASFSGWSLFGNVAIALNNQGVLILFNLFFAPAIVTARAISLQINNAANQFVNNFRTAVNPQITKRYAAGDIEGSKKLLLQSTKFSYFLTFMLALPICLVAEQLLDLWLVEVPEYAVIFLQLIVIQSLCQVFDTSFFQALYTKGRIKENSLITPTISLLRFPVAYVLFRYGFSPVTLSWMSIFTYSILSFIVKPVLLVRICDYKWKEISDVFSTCFKVTFFSILVPCFLYYQKDNIFSNQVASFFLLIIVSISSVIIFVWLLGLDKTMKNACMSYMYKKINRSK